MKAVLLSGILTVVFSSQSLAAGSGAVSFPYLSYFKSLLTIIVLLVAFLYVTKHFMRRGRTVHGAVRQIEILDRVQLEPQVALYLVRLRDKVWLLSAGSKQTQVIDDVSSLVDVQDLPRQYTFKDTLDKIIRKKDANSEDNT